MVDSTKRKKWSKGKSKEKSNNMVLIDRETYERVIKEVCKNKLLTPSNLTERFHISCSLAKKIFKNLVSYDLISEFKRSNKQSIYIKKNI
nr:40S ribosomal protein S25 [Cryptomonas sp.]